MDDQTEQRVLLPAQLKKFALAAGVLALCFSVPLWRLARFAAGDEFYSYILLIPAVSAYLAWLQKKNLPQLSCPEKKLPHFFSPAVLPRRPGTGWFRFLPGWMTWRE